MELVAVIRSMLPSDLHLWEQSAHQLLLSISAGSLMQTPRSEEILLIGGYETEESKRQASSVAVGFGCLVKDV